MEQEIRKPYYVTIMNNGYNIYKGLKPNKVGGGGYFVLNLSDEEYNRYDINKLKKLLAPYKEIYSKRISHCPIELLIWAIEEVIYGREES